MRPRPLGLLTQLDRRLVLSSEKAYLKGELQFVGSGMPALRVIVKGWLRAHPGLQNDDLFAVAGALCANPVHECRQSAVEILVLRPTLITLVDVPWLYNTLRDSDTSALVDPPPGSIGSSNTRRRCCPGRISSSVRCSAGCCARWPRRTSGEATKQRRVVEHEPELVDLQLGRAPCLHLLEQPAM